MPVVSIGNLVAGGTGKTPVVIALAQALRRAGRHPGILARGYRRAPGARLNDEGLEIERALGPSVPQVQHARRVRGGRALLAAHPDVDVVLLDDGFQHRQLHRDVDVVLLHAVRPFGGGVLLPLGRLRERPRALARADAVLITHCERVDAAQIADLEQRVATYSDAPVHRATRHAVAVQDSEGVHPPEKLCDRRVHVAAGVASPQGVAGTLSDLGAAVLRVTALGDHARVAPSRWAALVRAARDDGAVLVVTRKDAVKMSGLLPGMNVLDTEMRVPAALIERILAATSRDHSSSGPSTSGSVRS